MSGDDHVRQLYAAYQDWRARVYGELDRLSVEGFRNHWNEKSG